MSLSLSIDKETVLAEARRHPRYDSDPGFYEKLASLKLSSAQDRHRLDVKLQSIQDNVNHMIAANKSRDEEKLKPLNLIFSTETLLCIMMGLLSLMILDLVLI